ncbi:MAG: L,D-transpeptidase family protein [Hyphomicrobium sp.]
MRALSPRSSRGVLEWGLQRATCALGRSGVRAMKREGDGATPRGVWTLREAFYNADRMNRPRTRLPLRRLRIDDGWCDAQMDPNYNRAVRHPYPASAERLFRADGLYDIVVVLGYNDRPRVQGRGSAIFLHIARPGYGPTEGCVALRRDHALRVISKMRRGDVVKIQM